MVIVRIVRSRLTDVQFVKAKIVVAFAMRCAKILFGLGTICDANASRVISAIGATDCKFVARHVQARIKT